MGGDTWQLVTEVIQPETVLGIFPADPDIMIGVTKKGLVKSVNGGAKWQLLGEAGKDDHPLLTGRTKRSPPPGSLINIGKIKFHPKNQNLIYVAADSGLYRSDDGGTSWHTLQVPVPDNMLGYGQYPINSIGVPKSQPEHIVIGTSVGAFYSTDRGTSWKKIYPLK